MVEVPTMNHLPPRLRPLFWTGVVLIGCAMVLKFVALVAS
jgi:hypothetical protein